MRLCLIVDLHKGCESWQLLEVLRDLGHKAGIGCVYA